MPNGHWPGTNGGRFATPVATVVLLGLLSTPAAFGSHEIDFAPPDHFPTGDAPVDVAVGEFNGDGDPDLAVPNLGPDTVSIFLGGIGGGFSGPTDVSLAAGANPFEITVGDFNGDGDPDLGTANFGSDNVSVLLGGAGGTFTGPTNFGAATDPAGLAVGNFNPETDSDPDLAVANLNSNDVSVLLGGPGGTFAGPTNFAAGAPMGSGPGHIAVADFNLDSDPDLAVANGDNFAVLLGAAGGTFGAPTNFDLGAPSNPSEVVVGEFNGDSDPDLAVGDQGLDGVVIWLGTAGGGFDLGQVFRVGNVFALDIGELNGDGDSDLAIANLTPATASVLLGADGVRFIGPTSFATGGFETHAVEIADFNGDSTPDLAVANSGFDDSVSIHLQTAATGPAGPPGATGAPGAQGPAGRDATVTCKSKKGKRPKCTIVFTSSAKAGRASARLSRGATTFARGSAYVGDGQVKMPLIAKRPLARGRYLLTLKVREGGKTTVTRRKVQVG